MLDPGETPAGGDGDGPVQERIGPYVVGQELGRGGFGTVYQARHEVLGRQVAIKVLHAGHSRDAVATSRFVAEAKAVNTVHHPNIVEIFDFGILPDGRHFFVMELLDGRSLRALLEEKRQLTAGEALPLLEQIASALDAVHAAGLTHRDLKPDNILVTPDGVKVIDFGLVKLATSDLSLTDTNVVMGTPLYMSPEQFRGSSGVGPASDAYSFGAVAYQIFTGVPPFVASDPIGLALQVLNDVPVAPSEKRPGLPAGVDHFCLALLAKNPNDRPVRLVESLALLDRTGTVHFRARRLFRIGASLLAIAGVMFAISRFVSTPVAAPAPTPTVAFIGLPVTSLPPGIEEGDRASIAVAVTNMVRASMAHEATRGFWVADGPEGSERVELATSFSEGKVLIEARRNTQFLALGRGVTMAEAVEAMRPELARVLTSNRGVAPPNEQERAAMRETSAPSITAYRLYQNTIDDFDRALSVDTAPIVARAEALIATYPRWLRPYVQLCWLQGFESDACRATTTKARATADFAADPLGEALMFNSDHPDQRRESLRRLEAVPSAQTDQLGAMILGQLLFSNERAPESVELLGRLYRAHRELQYGINYGSALATLGRDGDVLATAREWSDLNPESSESLVFRASAEAHAGNTKMARSKLALRRLFLGETNDIWFSLFDAYVEVEDLVSAQRIVDKMLAFNDELRARGRYRAGLLAVLEGRLANAYDTFTIAARETAPLGSRSELTQVLSQQLAIAAVAGREDDIPRIQRERLACHEEPGLKAEISFEIALLGRKPGDVCPPMEPLLAKVEDPVEQQKSRRHMLSASAEVGCATCQQVFVAGVDELDGIAHYVASYARCAEAVGDLVAAQSAYARMIENRPTPDPSLYDALRVRANMARLLIKAGDTTKGIALARSLVETWRAADRTIPELTLAKKLIAPI